MHSAGISPLPDAVLVVVLSEHTENVDRSDGGEVVIKSSGPAEFDGGLGLHAGQPAFAARVVLEAGEVFIIAQAGVLDVIAAIPIENCLGFTTGISGGDLAFRAEVQAINFGARVTVPRQKMALRQENVLSVVELDDETIVRGRCVVLATGVRYRMLGLSEEEAFAGNGVYYAATELEARRCRNGPVIVIGAGNSAGQAAIFLSESSNLVHLVCRGPDLARTMSQYLSTRLEHTPNVRIHTESTVSALRGNAFVTSAAVVHAEGEEDVPVCALFVLIGADPCTSWLGEMVWLDEHNFILTGQEADASASSPFQTSQPGIFAVGDVRSGSVKRVASAVGKGSLVVQAVHRYLAEVGAGIQIHGDRIAVAAVPAVTAGPAGDPGLVPGR